MYGAYKAFFIYVHNMTKYRSRLLTCNTDFEVWLTCMISFPLLFLEKKKLNNVKSRSYFKLMFLFSSKDCFTYACTASLLVQMRRIETVNKSRLKATCTNFHLIQPVCLLEIKIYILASVLHTYDIWDFYALRMLWFKGKRKKGLLVLSVYLINICEN